MSRKSHRAKMLDISKEVRHSVYERDRSLCVSCGVYCELGHANSHYISRGRGGQGIERNIVTQCPQCHHVMDFGVEPALSNMKNIVREYLKSRYDDWNEEDLIYKWGSKYR